MNKRLLIRDLTLRDGQQSLFATRMRQEQIDRVLPFYKEANFYAMEVWGGAVPDSVMRYLSENPWERLEKIKAQVGDVSKLTALSRGRNLFGYTPYTDEIIEGFAKNSMKSGLGIMRIFDALNDLNNVKSTIKYVKQYGGLADCAVCYTIDPAYSKKERFAAKLKGKSLPKPVFTDEYFVNKAIELEKLGADLVTIKDMSGLIPPVRVAKMVSEFKKNLKIPVDFHTHCTPGYGLASVLMAIINGVDIVDTNIWNFSGGPAAPAIELIYIFCKKLGIELDVNMEAVAKINAELKVIREELADVDASKMFPKPFNPLTDELPREIEELFDQAIYQAKANKEDKLLESCHAIEAYFNFPKPNELVKTAQVPGGMYTNMVAQLKALKAEDILEDAMKLIPQVRLDSGLPPLVTPTSQIVGAQAVNCAMDVRNGKEMYSNTSVQFVSLVKGEYGKTPIPVAPEFREKITGSPEEKPYDTASYKLQPNPELENAGGVKLADNEQEFLLLELFPMVAKNYLTKVKVDKYNAENESSSATPVETIQPAKASTTEIKGKKVAFEMPGRVIELKVKRGDEVKKGDVIAVLEAMKMENKVTSDLNGFINNVYVEVGENIAANTVIVDIVDEPVAVDVVAASPKTANAAPVVTKAKATNKKVSFPMPGRVVDIKVSVGDKLTKGQEVAVLEAMKMENKITSDFDGYVNNIYVELGQNVAADTLIMDVADEPVVVAAPVVALEDETRKPVRKEISGKAVVSPMPGKILNLSVKEGDVIKKGQLILTLEAMKMENSITSDFSGIVNNILVEVDENVAADQKLITVEVN